MKYALVVITLFISSNGFAKDYGYKQEEYGYSRYKIQQQALSEWLAHAKNVVIIELGAGKDIPTVRYFGEKLGWPLIRINPRDPDLGSSSGVSLPMGALAALNAIYFALN